MKPPRELCIMACCFCKDPEFWEWMRAWACTWADVTDPVDPSIAIAFTEPGAKAFILSLCGVDSRNLLDTVPAAAARFHELVRLPFIEWKRTRAEAAIGMPLPLGGAQ